MNIFPILYFPPILYFLDWNKSKKNFIEANENYQKQSFRNRMTILCNRGRFDLFIPIVHNSKTRLYRDVKISFNHIWQKNHWKTLECSYRSSPYFEYYEDSIYQLIHQKTEYLFEFNVTILNWVIKTFQLPNYRLTQKFEYTFKGQDFRNCYKATKLKRNAIAPYLQVFSDRFEFENNLSILDFLFNIGPDKKYLIHL